MKIGWYLARSYILFFIMAILAFAVMSNNKMEKNVKKKFYALLGITILQEVACELDLYFSTWEVANAPRFVFSTIGYLLYPAVMYFIILIMIRDESRKTQLLIGIPWFLYVVVLFQNLVTENVFYFDAENHHKPSTLFPLTYCILLLYLALILYFDVHLHKGTFTREEFLTVLIGVGFVVINMCGELLVEGYENNSVFATALAILTYSIYFRTEAQVEERNTLASREMRTGLYNERAFVDRLDEWKTKEDITRFSIVNFDLSRFGAINDQYGLDVGNQALVEYGKKLNDILGKEEFLARQGSDVFLAFVQRKNLDFFLNHLNGLLISFELEEEKYEMKIAATAGVYEIERTFMPAEEMISNASMALNYGKTARKSVTYATEEFSSMIREHKQFETEIPIAMEKEEFVPYYQPKVNSSTNILCGAEALVRWFHDGSLISPGKFIPVLERNDLMCDMDFYMLRHVCADLARWIERGIVPPTVSVNFSRRNLSNPNLAADIEAVVQEYRVPKKMIEIEITETIDEFPISVLRDFVDDLHKKGFTVAVDDFGSGSSSLSLLREVTFDTLKIDKGFVDKAYAKDLTILNYMIKLAKALNVEVLAEGVEQKEQVETLATLGCDIIQGYYYDKPLTKEQFERRIIMRRYENG